MQTYLIFPLIDDGHVDVVNEYRHPFAGDRSVRAAYSLVNVALDRTLRVKKRRNMKDRKPYNTKKAIASIIIDFIEL